MPERLSGDEHTPKDGGGEISPAELEVDQARVAEFRKRVEEIEAGFVAQAGRSEDEGRCSFRDITLNLLAAAGPDVRFLEDPEERAEEPEDVPREERDLRNCLELLEIYLETVTKHPEVLALEMTAEGAYPDERAEADRLATTQATSIDRYVRKLAEKIAESDKSQARQDIERLGS
jgi:hypothetical protein